jgi:N-terminal 7TM region of histidine kinase
VTAATRRTRTRWWPAGLAWALWGLAMLGLAVLAWLDRLLRRTARPELVVLTPTAIPPVLGAVGVATVGAMLASRRPRHPVGWLMLAFGLCLSAAGVAVAYTNYGVAQADAPAAGLVARYVPATIVTAIACNGFILLLAPTGSLPSPRWRWWAGVTAATPAALLLVVTLAPRPTDRLVEAVDSPLDLQAFDGGLLVAYLAAFTVLIIAFVVAAASLVVRFRRARGIKRQQLRWVALATVVVALLSVVHLAALTLGAYALAPLAGGLSPPILSAAIGAAILRYRLYDLDRIISRALAYGLLTVLLGGGYAGAVLALGQLFGVGERTPSWAVAGATLAAAALFQPARRRIQQAVDRRFNRRKYHAARTVQAFSARLRDQLDLDALSTELLAVVDQTVEPTRVSLWLRPSPPGSSGTARGEPRPPPWAY